ncbi:MAG: DUF1572 domain-containing protein [Chitinophagaceae bacterium]|nr:MAG: DUF1572 domain-containing protein [Chitinophagaceae bacterium]
MNTNYLESTLRQFAYYKSLGEKAMEQVPDDALFWQHNAESNSIATIVKHLWGNMRSRWTDLFTSDGEKPWRAREAEFENDIHTRAELLRLWEEGWTVLLSTLGSLAPEDLERIVYIRNQGHTVLEAINRQLAHYPYHIGQIVFIGKMWAQHWNSLSIPRGGSQQFNEEKFAGAKQKQHFTEDFLEKPRGESNQS